MVKEKTERANGYQMTPRWGALTCLTWPVSPVFTQTAAIMNNAPSPMSFDALKLQCVSVFSLSVYTSTHAIVIHEVSDESLNNAKRKVLEEPRIYQSKASASPCKSFKLRFTHMIRHAGLRQTPTCKQKSFSLAGQKSFLKRQHEAWWQVGQHIMYLKAKYCYIIRHISCCWAQRLLILSVRSFRNKNVINTTQRTHSPHTQFFVALLFKSTKRKMLSSQLKTLPHAFCKCKSFSKGRNKGFSRTNFNCGKTLCTSLNRYIQDSLHAGRAAAHLQQPADDHWQMAAHYFSIWLSGVAYCIYCT